MSSSDHDESSLPERVESLLVDWPAPERDEAFWDASSKAVQARLADVEQGSTPEELLAAPLPTTDDDGVLDTSGPNGVPSSTPDSVPDRPAPSAPAGSLADLARASMAASAKADDDLSDIARESLSLASRSRHSAPDIAAALANRPSRPSVPPASTPAPVPAPADADLARHSHPAPARKRRGSGPLIGAGVAVLGLAAAAMIFLRGHSQPEALATNPNVAPRAAAAAASAAPPKAASDDNAGVLSLDQLPNGELAAKPAATAAAPRALALGAKRSAPAATAAPQEEAKYKASSKGEKAAPDDKPIPGMKPAEGTTGGLPDKPSTGAVAVAVGAVLGSARACVAGQDKPSHAVIVFGSDGRVKGVSVSGPAAGTPAAGCIRAALSQARVQPFARDRFSVGTPVRPQ